MQLLMLIWIIMLILMIVLILIMMLMLFPSGDSFATSCASASSSASVGNLGKAIYSNISTFLFLKNFRLTKLSQVCDSSTLKFRPCELALALLCTEFQTLCAKHPANTTALMGFVTELQKYCHIESSKFVSLLSEVVAILERYNGEGQVPHRQRLVWKLSNRTLRHLRPTDRLRPTLPKICEEATSGVGDKACQLRLR